MLNSCSALDANPAFQHRPHVEKRVGECVAIVAVGAGGAQLSQESKILGRISSLDLSVQEPGGQSAEAKPLMHSQ
jgi:hypothetical protein